MAIRYMSPAGSAKVKAYEQARFKTGARKAKAAEYQRTHRKTYADRYKARTAVGNAVRDGRLFRKACEICGSENSQAHHTDYTQPLAVRWFCFEHHRKFAHKQNI
ncbi:MAG TPA: hypothetical protein VIT23_01145 [Terrimicrobiaceae bacterium]